MNTPAYISSLKQLSRLKKILVGVVAGLVLVIFAVLLTGWTYQHKHRNDPVKIGVSFSVKYAEELGVDWRANFLALLDDLHIKHYRLMSYWDSIEPSPGQFEFDDLDWQMGEAAKRGASVSLAIGQRQPRWPECHIPAWAKGITKEDYDQALYNMLQTVVSRYKNHPALASYQLENESRNRLFGDCQAFDKAVFEHEVKIVQTLDSNHQLIINTSNQMGVPLQKPVGDGTGFSVYKRAHFEALGKTWSWNYWYVPAWWHSLRASIIEHLHGNYTFIHELQAEPWGAKATKYLSDQEQAQTMDPAKLDEITDYAIKTGMKEFYYWGGEWWYWRLTAQNDPAMWDAVRSQLSQH